MPIVDIMDEFPSRFLKHSDIGKGKRVTIDTVAKEPVGAGERKPVLYFQDANVKPLVLNKTNAGVIADAFGRNPAKWAGCELQLYPSKTPFQGRTVDCIRVKAIPTIEHEVTEEDDHNDSSPATNGDDEVVAYSEPKKKATKKALPPKGDSDDDLGDEITY